MSMEPCGNCRFFRWKDMKCTVLGDGKEFMCLMTSPACERFEPTEEVGLDEEEVKND